jgi:hypothetical protein
MVDLSRADTFTLGDRVVNRVGYGDEMLAELNGIGEAAPPVD